MKINFVFMHLCNIMHCSLLICFLINHLGLSAFAIISWAFEHNCGLFYITKIIWAVSWQNQHNAFATCMDPDQSAQSDQDPCCSLSVSLLVIEFVSKQHVSWSDCADAQAGLDTCWLQTHYVGFVVTWLISKTTYI
jgi:hypothetical protein